MIELRPPGDKSITHRALILASLAAGESRVRGASCSDDARATAGALAALGYPMPELTSEEMRLPGPGTLGVPAASVDCRNSGTSARLLAGTLAGLGIETTLDGDASLRARPMHRVVYPLQAMGARIEYLEASGRLPLRIHGRASGALRPLRHRPRVASAQVKSAILLAGITARVAVEVLEPGSSRDHTERLLEAMGAPVETTPGDGGAGRVRLDPAGWDGRLEPLRLEVPGDISSAAFLIGASLLSRRPARLADVGLNPTRTGFLEILEDMGAPIEYRVARASCGEPIGDIAVSPPERLRPFRVAGERLPTLIDEIPLLAVLAVRAEGRSEIRDAAELRVKESDRIGRLAAGLTALGVECEEKPDGLVISGTPRTLAGRIETAGDHRIAMAFGVLGADPAVQVELDDPDCASISYPGFWTDLETFRS